MLKFECMYFLNQFLRILRISDGTLKMYFMRFYFGEHQKPKYYAKSSKERKDSKNLGIWEILSTQTLSTRLRNKYTRENEVKLENCEQL